MRFVETKTLEQQSCLMLHRTRQLQTCFTIPIKLVFVLSPDKSGGVSVGMCPTSRGPNPIGG
jgi:hypothetical protein